MLHDFSILLCFTCVTQTIKNQKNTEKFLCKSGQIVAKTKTKILIISPDDDLYCMYAIVNRNRKLIDNEIRELISWNDL